MVDRVVITFIRHGLTRENQEKRYIGWSNPSLSEQGIRELKSKVYPKSPDRLFSSDLNRCIETANIIYPHLKPILLKELREMNFGDFEGKTFEDLRDDIQYEQWLNDPFQIPPPNGESYASFKKRIHNGWSRILEAFQDPSIKQIVCVAHGGSIRELFTQFGPSDQGFWDYSIKHGDVLSLVGDREEVRRMYRCTLLQVGPLMEKENG
ncbi:histidine phosphatase family protein [Bacillus alveayuensis]|jgi:alpha-ribazole phosphatase|uniref:Alpha-ribazole phosphatase n=1 Tax=Aeribacillus alveayuensis TaxID=279215 RepID=A0ABT9VQ44_9BACI|nr:histidine phosphatase family protein [Bacillus alveayuensis]MDQ0163094.1 alpha-ribazole phosphatase [Bacillus alveayuensis]